MINQSCSDGVKVQPFVIGEWITVKSFSFEKINDIDCIFVHVAEKRLKRFLIG